MSAPVLLVRHGQSTWNVARRTQGQTPHPPLTEVGRAEARAAGDLVAARLGSGNVRPGGGWTLPPRVVTSDLVRARQTADLVAARLGVVATQDVRLREQHLGVLEGRPYEETWAAAELHDWSDRHLPVGHGESPAELAARMRSVLAEALLLAQGGNPVVLVSHGDAIRAAEESLLGAAGTTRWLEVPNGAVLEARPGAGLSRLV